MAKKNRKKARKMAARGASAREIAQKTGVKRSTARNITRRVAQSQSQSPTQSMQIYKQPTGTPIQTTAPERPAHVKESYVDAGSGKRYPTVFIPGAMKPGQVGYDPETGGGVWAAGPQSAEDIRAWYRSSDPWTTPMDKAISSSGKDASAFTLENLFGSSTQDMAISAAQEKARGGKRKGGGLRKQIKAAGPNISRSEFNDILRSAGGNVAKVLNRMTKVGAGLNSGAANMLATQLQESPFAFGRKGLGDSKIARTIRQMAGTPDYRSNKMRQMGLGGGEDPGTGMMIGGTVIRPGGKIAVKKRPTTAPVTTGIIPDEVGETEPTAGGDYEGSEFDFDSFLDQLTGGGMLPPQMPLTAEVPELPDYEELLSDVSTPDPLSLLPIGEVYAKDMIRARRRPRRTRRNYLRNTMAGLLSAAPQTLSPMMIGGGLTI